MTLQFTYIALTLLITIIIVMLGVKTIKKSFSGITKIRNKIILLITLLLLWHIYVFVIAQTAILQDYSLPPRVPLFLVLPTFVFIGIFAYINRNENWLQNIPEHWLIFCQTFRVSLEILFVFSVAKGIIHSNMTIESYNYDMVFASSAPFIGYWVYNRQRGFKTIAIYWNLRGLGVITSIIFVVVTTVYFPGFYGSSESLMSKEFGMYPYILVPAFLMPFAVLMHILSIVQLNKKKPQENARDSTTDYTVFWFYK